MARDDSNSITLGKSKAAISLRIRNWKKVNGKRGQIVRFQEKK